MGFFVYLIIFCVVLFVLYKLFLSGGSSAPVERQLLSTGYASKQKYVWLTSKVSFIPDVPQYAADEALNYRTDFLLKNSEVASDLTLAFNYDKVGNAYLEATVVLKEGAAWKFDTTWIWKKWSGSDVADGSVKYKMTQRILDGAQFRIEKRRQDKRFSEVEKVVLQISKDHVYDYMAADNVSVKYRTDTIKKTTSEGYSDAVVKAFGNHPLVDHVEKYVSGKFSWNVIVLKDEKKVYVDACWYDGHKIDSEGYAVEVPERNPANLTFDYTEFNTLGGAIDLTTGKMIGVHFLLEDVKKV